jgi:hypothetical protein
MKKEEKKQFFFDSGVNKRKFDTAVDNVEWLITSKIGGNIVFWE